MLYLGRGDRALQQGRRIGFRASGLDGVAKDPAGEGPYPTGGFEIPRFFQSAKGREYLGRLNVRYGEHSDFRPELVGEPAQLVERGFRPVLALGLLDILRCHQREGVDY